MSRGLWFVAGAGVGVYAMNKARRAAESLTVEGLRARWQGVQHAARLFSADVREGQVEREQQLRDQLGLPAVRPEAHRQLEAPPPAGRRLTLLPGDPAGPSETSRPTENDRNDTP